MEELVKCYHFLVDNGVPHLICNIFFIIGSLILYNLKLGPLINKYLYRKKLLRLSETDSIIKESIKEYRDLMVCDRLAIFEFHNNVHNLSGKSFIKFTCNYETTRLGVSQFNLSIRDYQLSAHKEVLDLVTNNKDIVIKGSELDKYSSEMNKHFQDGLVTNLVMTPINNKGFLVGFVIVEFTRDVTLTKDQIIDIIHKSHELSGKISNKVEYGR